jgi:hypothetical protein
LNRNYVTSRWGTTAGKFSDDRTADSYRGPSPGYAAEVQAMQTLVTTRQFLGTLDFHSYGRFILFPYCGRVEPHPDPLQDRMATNLERVIDSKGTDYQRISGAGFYPLIHGDLPADGVVPGGFMDFVVENLPEAIAITIELDPVWPTAHGFELAESEIEPTFARNRGGILSFLNCIGSLRNPPAARRLVLEPGAANDVVVYRGDCSAAFESY